MYGYHDSADAGNKNMVAGGQAADIVRGPLKKKSDII